MSDHPNDRIFVSTSSMADSVAVAWAAASSGILSPGDRDRFTGELLVHMDGRATIKWWEVDDADHHDTPFVLVIDPARRNGSYMSIYVTEDQPPAEDLEPVWRSTVEEVPA